MAERFHSTNQYCCYRCGVLQDDWVDARSLSRSILPIRWYAQYAYRTIPVMFYMDCRLIQFGDHLYLCTSCIRDMERGFIGLIVLEDLPLYINHVWVFDESVSLYRGRYTAP